MSLGELGQIFVNAVLLSGILALVALGFSLVWGIMNIVNLAHGAFIVLGAYVTFFLHELLHVDPFLSIPASMAVLFALGWVLQRGLVNQVIRAPLLATFLLTFGLELLIVNLINFFFKADLRSVTTPYSGTGFTLGPVRVPYIRLGALGVSLVLVAALAWYLKSTRTGRAIRATGMDLDAARLTGVKVASVYASTFAIGLFDSICGGTYTRLAFAICVLGGLGNVANVVIGAAIYAFVDVFVGARLPSLSRAVTFGILVLLLILRPQGIAGKSA